MKGWKKDIQNRNKLKEGWFNLFLKIFLLPAILITDLARAILKNPFKKCFYSQNKIYFSANTLTKTRKSFIANKTLITALTIFIALSITITAATAIPTTINLQGKLLSASGSALSGTYDFTFRIYDAYTGGNLLYESNNTLTSDSRGLYHVGLRDINLSFDQQYYLGIEVGSDPEMTPRINLSSMPYAFRANTSDDLNKNNTYTVSVLNVTNNVTLGDSATDKIIITTSNLNVTETGNLDVVGNLSIAEKIRFSLGEIIDNIIDGWLRITGNVNITENLVVGKNLTVNNSDLFVDSNLGRVGIGTVTPTQTLTVKGDLNVTGQSYLNNLNISGVTFSEGNIQGNNITASAGYYFIGNGSQLTDLNAAQITTGTIAEARLPSTIYTIALNASKIDTGTIADARLSSNVFLLDTGGTITGATTINALTLGGNMDANNYNITNLDKVGIGTSTPLQELVVVGDLNVTGTSYLSDITLKADNITVNNIISKDGNITFNNNSNAEMMKITADGKVGIGTTGPGAKLEVAGQVKITGGTPAAGEVLTSDASGLATWEPAGVPAGAVMFFNLAACPAGWTELTSAQGRYLVGLPSGGTLAESIGTALGAHENRDVAKHTHDISDPGHNHALPTASAGGVTQHVMYQQIVIRKYDASYTAASTTGISVNVYPTDGKTGTNAPYLALLVCQKN